MKAGRADRLAGLIVAMVAVGVWLPVASPQQREFGRTIAAITVGQDRLDRVRSLYGPGAQTTNSGVQSLCYRVEQDQSYLSVSTFERDTRVREVMLTTFAAAIPGLSGCENQRQTSHCVERHRLG